MFENYIRLHVKYPGIYLTKYGLIEYHSFPTYHDDLFYKNIFFSKVIGVTKCASNYKGS